MEEPRPELVEFATDIISHALIKDGFKWSPPSQEANFERTISLAVRKAVKLCLDDFPNRCSRIKIIDPKGRDVHDLIVQLYATGIITCKQKYEHNWMRILFLLGWAVQMAYLFKAEPESQDTLHFIAYYLAVILAAFENWIIESGGWKLLGQWCLSKVIRRNERLLPV